MDRFFSSLRVGQNALLLEFVLLVTMDLLASLFFIGLLTQLIVTRHVSHYWNACFILSAAVLGGWMIFYAQPLWVVGLGIGAELKNLLAYWFLVCAVLISAGVRFASPYRYISVAIVVLSLAAYEIAGVGILRSTIRMLRQKQN